MHHLEQRLKEADDLIVEKYEKKRKDLAKQMKTYFQGLCFEVRHKVYKDSPSSKNISIPHLF